MAVKHTYSGKATSIPKGIAAGILASVCVTTMGAIILGRMVATESIPWHRIGYGIMIVLFLSSYIGAWVSFKNIKRKKLMVAAISGLSYWGILLMSTALFFGGQYEAVGITAGIIVAGCGTFFLIGNTWNKSTRKRVHKKRYS